MLAALKSEARKLLTVRSTYFISLLTIGIIALGSIYVEGYTDKGAPLNTHKLTNVIYSATGTFAELGALIAILLMAHEYRYGTITYTLTSINSRIKVLAAKFLTVTWFSLLFGIISIALTVGLTILGIKLKGNVLPHQDFNFLLTIGRSLFYEVGLALSALVIVVLTRNQIASVVIFLLFPTLGEQLLRLVLSDRANYLPFKALGAVISQGEHPISPGKGAAIFLVYLIILWLVAGILFLRRDAN